MLWDGRTPLARLFSAPATAYPLCQLAVSTWCGLPDSNRLPVMSRALGLPA